MEATSGVQLPPWLRAGREEGVETGTPDQGTFDTALDLPDEIPTTLGQSDAGPTCGLT